MKRTILVVAMILGGLSPLAAQNQSNSAPAPAPGKPIFESHCAACHGLDGSGGEAPNIASAANVRAMSDAQVTQIVHDGMTGGMPGFSGNLSATEITEIVSYLRDLQHPRQSGAAGDSANGKAVFFGKGGCSGCHMVQGSGGFIGPGLSGLPLSADDIRSAIVTPTSSPTGTLTTLTLKSGQKISGVVRNEDNFSIQLQDQKGGFHFLDKADVVNTERAAVPLMPADYGTKLSTAELQDLVAYLVSQANPNVGRGRGRRQQ
jgi:cytochrome c oxidase cbb3-type subunit 3